MNAPRVELFSLPGNCFIYEADLNDKLIHYAHDKLIQVSLKHAFTNELYSLYVLGKNEQFCKNH